MKSWFKVLDWSYQTDFSAIGIVPDGSKFNSLVLSSYLLPFPLIMWSNSVTWMFIQFTFKNKRVKNCFFPPFKSTTLLNNTIIFKLSGIFLQGNYIYKFPMWLLYMIKVDFKHKYSIIHHIYILSYIWRNMLAVWQSLEPYSVFEFSIKAHRPDVADLTMDDKMLPGSSSHHPVWACLGASPALTGTWS